MSRRRASVMCLLLGLVVLYGGVGLLLGLLFGHSLAGLVFGVAMGVLNSVPVLLLMGAALLETTAPRRVTWRVRHGNPYPEEPALGRAGRATGDRRPCQRPQEAQGLLAEADRQEQDANALMELVRNGDRRPRDR